MLDSDWQVFRDFTLFYSSAFADAANSLGIKYGRRYFNRYKNQALSFMQLDIFCFGALIGLKRIPFKKLYPHLVVLIKEERRVESVQQN